MSEIQATIFPGDTRRSDDRATGLPVLKSTASGLLDFAITEISVSALRHFGDQSCARPKDGKRACGGARHAHSRFAPEKIPALFLPQGNELHRVFADTLFNTNLVIQTQMTNRED
jgi:hypothetical protein